jgi:hypothetical protein
MNSNVSTEEIVIILAGCEQTLRLIQATPEYLSLIHISEPTRPLF